MFRNISLNLKTGGRFVGVTLPAAEDPLAFLDAERSLPAPPLGSGLFHYNFIKHVKDGIFFNCYGDTEMGSVDFDCYHLRRDVSEAAAKEAGLEGELYWDVTQVPERFLSNRLCGMKWR